MNEQKVRDTTPQGQPEKGYEDRPGWTSCFPPRNPNSRANFVGVTVLNGKKHWVSVYLKTTRSGSPFASVHVEAWREDQ